MGGNQSFGGSTTTGFSNWHDISVMCFFLLLFAVILACELVKPSVQWALQGFTTVFSI